MTRMLASDWLTVPMLNPEYLALTPGVNLPSRGLILITLQQRGDPPASVNSLVSGEKGVFSRYNYWTINNHAILLKNIIRLHDIFQAVELDLIAKYSNWQSSGSLTVFILTRVMYGCWPVHCNLVSLHSDLDGDNLSERLGVWHGGWEMMSGGRYVKWFSVNHLKHTLRIRKINWIWINRKY